MIQHTRISNFQSELIKKFCVLSFQDEVKGDWPLYAIIATAQPVSRKTANCIGKLCKVFGTIYGSTEIGIAFYTMVDNVDDFTDFYIGQPLEGNAVKIVDDEGATLPVHEIGEILVRTDTLFKEYCNEPEKTRMRLIDDGPDRWYVTGDVGYMNTNGAFFCLGRKSEIIMSSSLKVMPSSIESVLISSAGVVSAVCIPVAHEIKLNVICACVVLIPGCGVTEEDLRQHCEAAHTEKPHLVNIVPSYYMFLEKFPKTRTGKIDKIELKRIAEEKYRPN